MTKDQSDMSDIIDELHAELMLLEGDPEPYYIISGSGDAWYHDVETRELVMISRGTEVVPIPDDPTGKAINKGHTLVRAPHRFLWIPEEEILEIGWN